MPYIKKNYPILSFKLDNASTEFDSIAKPSYLALDNWNADNFVEYGTSEDGGRITATYTNDNNDTLLVEAYPKEYIDSNYDCNKLLYGTKTSGSRIFYYTQPGYLRFVGIYGVLTRIDCFWGDETSNYDVRKATIITAQSGEVSQDSNWNRQGIQPAYYLYDNIRVNGDLLLTLKNSNASYQGAYFSLNHIELTLSDQ